MYPRLKIESDSHDTVEIETLPVDFMMYEELQGTKAASEQGMRLTIAYYYLEDKEPGSLSTVKLWARRNRVKVEMVQDDAEPFTEAATAG
tara:strand:+ start:822 stop:1091 length:270 start_codon:yes stop_codon:yes gene_type:complete